MVDFRISRPLLIVTRCLFAAIGGLMLLASFAGPSEPGVLPILGVVAIAVVGAALLALAIFGPPKWCAAVLWFCQW